MAAPVAKFTVSTKWLTANFDGLSKSKAGTTPGAVNYLKKAEWEFGDGSPTLVVNQGRGKPAEPNWRPSHTYPSAGTWNVNLKVTDSANQSHTYYGSVTVIAPPPPDRWFDYESTYLYVDFKGSNGAGNWTFGDGGTSTGTTSPTHVYASPGTYSVTYTVSGTPITRLVTVVDPYTALPFEEALRLEVSQDLGEAFPWNRLDNPNGQYGTTGWSTPANGGKVTQDPAGLKYTAGPVNQLQPVISQTIPCIPGRYITSGFQFLGRSTGYVMVQQQIMNAAGTIISNTNTAYLSSPGLVRTTPTKVPSTGRFVRFAAYLTRSNSDLTTAQAGDWFKFSQGIIASSLYESEVTSLPYQEGQPWADVLGPTHEIGITRSELDVSTLQADILDATLDPIVSDVIRTGAKCRLRIQTDQGGNTVWEPLFTGRVSDVDTDYKPVETSVIWDEVTNQLIPNDEMKTNLNCWGLDLLGAYTSMSAHATNGGTITVTSMPTATSAWGPYTKIPVVRGRTYEIYGLIKDLTASLTDSWCIRLRIRAFDALDNDLGDVLVGGSTTKPVRAGENGQTTSFSWSLGSLPVGTVCINIYLSPENTSGSTRTWTQSFPAIRLAETYNAPALPTDKKATRITLTASDDMAILAAVDEPRTVAQIKNLPELLESTAVPFQVNGSADQIGTPVVIAVNDSAKLLDQVVVARDNDNGYAAMSRAGILTCWSPDAPGFPVWDEGEDGRIIDASKYSSYKAGFSTSSIVNSLVVKWLHIVNGETVEDTYGPYEDPESIRKWGLRRQEITWAGTSDSVIAARATAFLAANSTPKQTCESVTVPIRYLSDITPYLALLDLMDPQVILLTNPFRAPHVRVREIKHTIRATKDGVKWVMELGFKPDGSAARVIEVPSPPVNMAVEALPFGSRSGSGTQSIPDATYTLVTFLSANVTEQGGVTFSSNRFVVPKAGIYLVSGRLVWQANATTNKLRIMDLRKNDVRIAGITVAGENVSHGQAGSVPVLCNEGDTISLWAYHNVGSAINIINNAGDTGLSVLYQGV